MAGETAAQRARLMQRSRLNARDAAPALALVAVQGAASPAFNPAALIAHLQGVMSRRVGPFRTEAGLSEALAEIARLAAALGTHPAGAAQAFDTTRLDWFDLRNMVLVAEAVARAALARTESRGAHQREDFPTLADAWAHNQTLQLADGALVLARVPATATAAAQ